MPIQEVVIFTNIGYVESTDELKASFPPPKETIVLAEDLRLEKLERSLASRIMDSCEPLGEWSKPPIRAFSQLYSFVRDPAPDDEPYQWERDQRLQTCIAYSRIIHPTSVSLEYSARLLYSDDGDLREIVPGPVNGHAACAYVVPSHRDWLTADDCESLKQLLNNSWTSFPERLKRAFWYHEYAAGIHRLDLRWTLICTALEALIHTDRVHSTRQFIVRVSGLSKEGAHEFPEDDASLAYELRSRLSHGGELENATPAELSLFQAMEAVLRGTLKKALVDPDFSNVFQSDNAIRQRWPIDC